MKKILIILLFVLVGCSNNTTKSNDLNYETLKNVNHNIVEKSIDDLTKLNTDKESYYLMIGRPSCSYCVDNIAEYAKTSKQYNIKEVYYYSSERINSADDKLSTELAKELKFLQDNYKFDGATPVFYYIKDGKISISTDDIDQTNITTWPQLLDKFFKETTNK